MFLGGISEAAGRAETLGAERNKKRDLAQLLGEDEDSGCVCDREQLPRGAVELTRGIQWVLYASTSRITCPHIG